MIDQLDAWVGAPGETVVIRGVNFVDVRNVWFGNIEALFLRGGKPRLFRVGVGLNVFNNVPKEGISLKQIIGDKRMNINFWSSEVLLAIERSLDLLDNQNFLCSQVEQRLWSRKYIDKETGLRNREIMQQVD